MVEICANNNDIGKVPTPVSIPTNVGFWRDRGVPSKPGLFLRERQKYFKGESVGN